MVKPKPVPTGDWTYQKILWDSDFIAAGQLVIPPKCRKPSKATKDNTYVRVSPSVFPGVEMLSFLPCAGIFSFFSPTRGRILWLLSWLGAHANECYCFVLFLQIFYVIEGAVNLKIHDTSLVLATGGMFMVPRGKSPLPLSLLLLSHPNASRQATPISSKTSLSAPPVSSSHKHARQ